MLKKQIPPTVMFYLWLFILAACSKHNAAPFIPPPVSGNDDPAQYGVPYTAVPDAPDVVMYQVNIRAFSAAGDFKGVQARLDSISALGVNTLYLLPVYPVGVLKSVNSPYCVKDFASVNSEFGSLDDLRTLVSEAHKRNIAVLLDWVANHTSWDHAWISNKNWYQQDAGGNIISPPNTGWNDVAQLNFTNQDMRKAMIKAMKYWVFTANIDGYRCDAADFVPADFWKQALDSLKGIGTHKLLLYAEGTNKQEFTAGFHLQYGMGFYYTMKDRVFKTGASAKLIDSLNTAEYINAAPAQQVTRYTSNHDVDNSDGTPLDLFGGKRGSMAVFLVAAYMNSVPMIYNGQEVGCPVKLTYFNHSTVIDWTTNPDMVAEYKKILAFRNSSGAIKKGNLVSYSSDDVCAFTKTLNSEKVWVLVNLRNTTLTYTIPAALTGSNWKNVIDGSSFTAGSSVSLQPFEYRIYRNN